jgi:hypothetical protein
LRELRHHSLQLQIFRFGYVRGQTYQAERLFFCLGEGGGFV